MAELQLIIITGMSGAGKTLAIRFLEDDGYYCVDNLPPALIPTFVDLCVKSQISKTALVMDIRGGDFFNALDDSLTYIQNHGLMYEILFLEASTEVLIRRFKETRRRHPLADHGRLADGIELERKRVAGVRNNASKIINTTDLSPAQLKSELRHYFNRGADSDNLIITILSFGFKHGIPLDVDLVFDVRFLRNPYYESDLRHLSGTNASVQKYVWQEEITHQFVAKLLDMLAFLIPLYKAEGKTQLVIAIGCTGGVHRSVAIACHLYEALSSAEHRVVLEHRDMQVMRVENQ